MRLQLCVVLFIFLFMGGCGDDKKSSSETEQQSSARAFVAKRDFDLTAEERQVFASGKTSKKVSSVSFSTGARMEVEVITTYTPKRDSAIQSISVFEIAKGKNATSKADIQDQFIIQDGSRWIGSALLDLHSVVSTTTRLNQNTKRFTVEATGELKEETKIDK